MHAFIQTITVDQYANTRVKRYDKKHRLTIHGKPRNLTVPPYMFATGYRTLRLPRTPSGPFNDPSTPSPADEHPAGN